MSYDISIMNWRNDCTECGRYHEHWETNYTSNVSAIWKHGLGFPLHFLNGVHVADALPYLTKALERLHDSRSEEYLRSLEPENGWGNLEGAIGVIRDLRDECETLTLKEKYPSVYRISVSH